MCAVVDATGGTNSQVTQSGGSSVVRPHAAYRSSLGTGCLASCQTDRYPTSTMHLPAGLGSLWPARQRDQSEEATSKHDVERQVPEDVATDAGQPRLPYLAMLASRAYHGVVATFEVHLKPSASTLCISDGSLRKKRQHKPRGTTG